MHVAVMGASSTGPASRSSPTSASRCRAPARRPWRRCTSTARKTVTLKATASPRNSSAGRRLRTCDIRRRARRRALEARPASTSPSRRWRKAETDGDWVAAVRGMNDVLPRRGAAVGAASRTPHVPCFVQYGYRNIRVPHRGADRLFVRGIGEFPTCREGDVTFEDKLSTASP